MIYGVTLYAIQFVRTPVSLHEDVGVEDLDWETVRGHAEYTDWTVANDTAAEFDAAFDGAYAHRVVELTVVKPVRGGK